MNSVMMKAAFFGMLGATALLVGCGGGGGGGAGSTFTPPNISNTPVTIDSTNQYDVADAAENGVAGAVDGGGGVLGVVVSDGGNSFSAFDFAESTLLKYASKAAAASQSSPAGVSVSVTEPCESGSINITANVSDPNGTSLTSGDTFSMAFNSCVDTGSTTSGSMTFSVVSGSLDFNSVSITSPVEISVTFNNLRTTEMGVTEVIHGDFNMSTDGTTETLSGDSLYVLETGGEAAHLTSFTITNTTANTTTDTVSVDLTIAGTDINGVIRVQTAAGAPLVQGMFEQHPSSGTLIVTGASSRLTMVITSSTEVSLYLDTDGDGLDDIGPIPATWDEVDNGAATIP